MALNGDLNRLPAPGVHQSLKSHGVLGVASVAILLVVVVSLLPVLLVEEIGLRSVHFVMDNKPDHKQLLRLQKASSAPDQLLNVPGWLRVVNPIEILGNQE